MNALKKLFMLDPEITFLNHGSFGATPRPVFDEFLAWLQRMERQPVVFVDREMPAYLKTAREELGRYLNAAADDLVYVPNATFGVNVVARSLSLGPGDEVLASDHEYGACDRIWRFMSEKRGFVYARQTIPLPVPSPGDIVEHVWRGVTPRTKVIFLSHITSSTAMHLPVETICARAREAGILTVIDGAHAPGQITVDLQAIGADFYAGNAHKWLSAPKGSGFLYARPDRQNLIEPLVVGWGWGKERAFSYGSDYLDYLQWLGTDYIAAYLAVPAAIRFQAEHDWPAVRLRCHVLLSQAVGRICELVGQPSVYPDDSYYHQMAIAPLPPIPDLRAFKAHFYDNYKVEIPFTQWRDRAFIRVSVQGYNTQEDIDHLLTALSECLPAASQA